MDGKVLGFDAVSGSGAIKGADGARYGFTVGDWRGSGAPKPGEAVDFEVEDKTARDIYPARSGGGLNIDLSGLAAGTAGGGLSASAPNIPPVLLASWAPLAAIAILIFCLLPFMSSAAESTNLFGVVGSADRVKMAIDEMSASFAALSQMQNAFGGMFGQPSAPAPEVPAFLGTTKFFLSLYPAFYLIPLAAIWVLAFAFLGKPLQLPALVLGVLAVVLPIVLIFVAALVIKASIPSEIRASIPDGSLTSGFGIGGWLIILAGAGLLLSLFGVVKATPGSLLNRS